MDVLRISASSRQFIKSRILATVSGAAVDPTADVVKVAFTLTGASIQPTDWQTGAWETDATATPTRYSAMCLVGPGGTIQLATGTYHMWIQITDNPEIPVLEAGLVQVY